MNTNTSGILSGVTLDATIILPPGSTSGELQTAINEAVSGDVIEISSDMSFTATVTLPVAKQITIQSGAGSNWVLTRAVTGSRHFTVNGFLLLQNIILDGGSIGGGVAVNSGGALIMNDGTAIQNCRGANGGGVYMNGAGATFTMNGGAIRYNIASSGGGGAYISNGGLFSMYGGVIEYNETSGASANGGGVFVSEGTIDLYNSAVIRFNTVVGRNSEGAGVFVNEGEFNLHGGEIEQNEAPGTNSFGGGAAVWDSNFYMSGGAIHGNISADGGGVSTDGSYFQMTGGSIYGNTAKGGGAVTVIGVGTVGTFGGRGGGVMDNTFSTFEMTGGEIRDNRNEPGDNTSGLNGFNGPSKGGGVYVYYGSTFIMGGTAQIANNTANKGGGFAAVGTSTSSNTMLMGGNAAVTANHADEGGGVCFLVGHTSYNFYVGSNFLTMNENAAITGNTSVGSGGGMFMYSVNATGENARNSLTMNGQASITGNTAGQDGGGVYMNMVENANAGNSFLMNENASVAGNTAYESGGGVYIDGAETPVSSVTLNDASVITANIATTRNGGGIYLAIPAFLEITGSSLITNNSAPNGNGGGINTVDLTYQNLSTGSGTVFSGNTAAMAFPPPPNASLLYPNIGFASTSITAHPLNNFDINFTNGVPLTFQVTYDPNGGTGSHVDTDITPGTAYTVLAPGEVEIERAGYTFAAWNTEPDGGGVSYAPGDMRPITEDLTLYAQWIASSADLYTVAYVANGGTGAYLDIDIPINTQYAILSPQDVGISRAGYTFFAWNTEPDGSGIAYQPGDVITISSNLTLYAQWISTVSPPCCIPCCRPCCRPCHKQCCCPWHFISFHH